MEGLRVGEKLIWNVWAASVPLFLEDLTSVIKAFYQVEATGYAIIHDLIPVVKFQEDLPLDLTMFTFDQSGTLYRLHQLIGSSKKLVK